MAGTTLRTRAEIRAEASGQNAHALARCLRRHGLNKRPLEDKHAPLAHKFCKDYAAGFVHVDIKYLPQMADETCRRYLLLAIDCATCWVYVHICTDQSEASSTDFLR